MPLKAQEVLSSGCRFEVLEGGRGGGKSYSVADHLIARAARKPLRILCARETQKSIRESVHRLLSDRIKATGHEDCFIIQKDSIRSGCGSEFIFKGLQSQTQKDGIRSTEAIDIAWVEEAERVSQDSWDTLIPTIRKPNSQIIITFNQESEKSATYNLCIKNPRPDMAIAHITFRDNKLFPEVLRNEMEYCRTTDPDKYNHIWEGGLKEYHDAVIFAGKIVELDFETLKCVQFHYGCDWGFSGDPLAITRYFILDKSLYIDYEFYARGIDYSDYEEAFDSIPGIRDGRIRADSAYPASISHVKNLGFDIIGAKKGAGSVEDGILFLKGFEHIYIHTRCPGALDDFKNYRYKQDPLTKEILPIIVDKSNHTPDNARYALEPLIKPKRSWVAV